MVHKDIFRVIPATHTVPNIYLNGIMLLARLALHFDTDIVNSKIKGNLFQVNPT